MKFGVQFEFHKIPEWYSEYLDYVRFKKLIKDFKLKVKGKLESFILEIYFQLNDEIIPVCILNFLITYYRWKSLKT
jgi:hypothetical protein